MPPRDIGAVKACFGDRYYWDPSTLSDVKCPVTAATQSLGVDDAAIVPELL